MTSKRVMLAAGLCMSLATGAHAQDSLVINMYTGVWGASMKKCIFDPFQEANKVTLQLDQKVSSVTYTSLRQQKDNPQIDVAWLDGAESDQSWADSLVDAIDPAKVPNMKHVDKRALHQTDGKVYAVGTGFYATGPFQNTKEVKKKITSWFDLWDPALANRVVLPGTELSNFAPIFIFLNKQLGGDNKNFEPAIAKFKELKALSYYPSSGVVASSIQSGEALAGAHYPNAIWALNDQNVPVEPVVPKEGVVAGDIRVHLVKGTKKKALAEKLIDHALKEDVLTCLGENLFIGPPIKNPKLSDKAKQRMPWGANGSLDNLVMPNWKEVGELKPMLIDLWNRRVVQK
ncbi:MAG: extracellular solute-binding protein [Alphaproteobacteria bacterium]|nr:extracellular solute-binding protein [Alphaproteobacteria bacterium]